VIKTLAQYAPDLPSLVEGVQVITPKDLECEYGFTGGHIFHGELALDQIFTMRPVLDWARYKTPVRGLFLCGNGTHPGNGLTGASGANAAREIIHELREHDRSQETSAITNERRKAVHRGTSAVGGAVCAGEGFAAERRADELDEEVGGGVSGFVARAKGAHFTDVDGREYVDLCLAIRGNDGAFAGDCGRGHRQASARRHHADVADGRFAVGRRRVETAIWIAVLAVCVDSDGCERFAIRIAREITQRSKVLVFNYCYHGTVDESFATIHGGVVGPRRGNIGPPVNPAETTRVIEFNDLSALEDALKHHDVAVVLAEPAMTNVGIILPDEGYWKAARKLTRRYGSLLIADETHTICAGPGGCTREWKLNRILWCLESRLGAEFRERRMALPKKSRSGLRRGFIWKIAMWAELAGPWQGMRCRWWQCA